MRTMASGRHRDGDGIILEARGLTKVFESGPTAVRAVDDVDLTVRRGEIVLIGGPSGAGKTTLLTMIGGVLRPTSGSVRIGGHKITAMRESELVQVRRHLLGFVFQTFNLFESLTALENVEIVLNFAGATGRAARERATGLLVEQGLGDRLHFKPELLSGGERQRVSIARAIANDPELILADEPTGNLDSRTGRDIAVLLRERAKAQGRTLIIVSHDLRLREIAGRVLWLEDGRFKEKTSSTDYAEGTVSAGDT